MQKILILGRGGAGKSTFARCLGKILGIEVIELDKHFWQPGLLPTPKDEWIQLQENLTSGKSWVLDGDLGKYDVLGVRLRAADTIILLDFPLLPCAWRAFCRSRERLDFWWWLVTWPILELPKINRAIAEHAAETKLYRFHGPKELRLFLDQCSGQDGAGGL